MIYAAHERDLETILSCIDIPAFHKEYLSRTQDNPAMSYAAFEQGLTTALSGSYSPKLDEVLKGLKGREKYQFIQMFVKAYAAVETKGDTSHIVVQAQDESGEKPEAFLKKTRGEWRIIWVEPFERLRAMFDEKQQGPGAAPDEQSTVFDPAHAEAAGPPALTLAPAQRTPDQVLATLLVGLDRREWPLALQSFDIPGLRDKLVRDMPALDFLTPDKLKDTFAKLLARSKHDFGGFLPDEMNRLKGDEKALMVELTVRALSRTEVHGNTASITVQNPDKPEKKYTYKMNKTADGWKIDVLSVFTDLLDSFLKQLDLN